MDDVSASVQSLPAEPPFRLRAWVLSPLAEGGFLDERDGVVDVDEAGQIAWVGSASAAKERPTSAPVVDVRPLLALPGLIDLHGHLPQLPIAATGFGVRIMEWLPKVMHPVERGFDREASERRSPQYLRLLAASGTTLSVLYGSVDAGAMDAAFAAAEAHGMRVIMGQALMDRARYDDEIPDDRVTDVRLQEAADTCARWNGAADGRLRYAFTPRWGYQCSREMMAESARLAREADTWWQTHLSEDPAEPEAVPAEYPEALDFLDVYDRAGGLGPRAILAHAVHLNDREIDRIRETESVVAHNPACNVFLGGGMMRLALYRERGLRVGLGTDVGGGFTYSLFDAMQYGATTQNARSVLLGDAEADLRGRFAALDWLQLVSLENARCLGLEDRIGSLEAGKDADLVLVDPLAAAPVPDHWITEEASAETVVSWLMFRSRSDMVRASWVRGRRLPGPAGWDR